MNIMTRIGRIRIHNNLIRHNYSSVFEIMGNIIVLQASIQPDCVEYVCLCEQFRPLRSQHDVVPEYVVTKGHDNRIKFKEYDE